MYIYLYIYTCIYIHAYICISYVYVSVYIYMYVCVYTHTYSCMYVHTCTYIHTYIYSYIYICIYSTKSCVLTFAKIQTALQSHFSIKKRKKTCLGKKGVDGDGKEKAPTTNLLDLRRAQNTSIMLSKFRCCSVLQCVAVCCSVLQCE